MTDPTPEKIYRDLKAYLAEEVARDQEHGPGGSKALWLYQNLHRLKPALLRAREARNITERIAKGGAGRTPPFNGTGTEGG